MTACEFVVTFRISWSPWYETKPGLRAHISSIRP